MTEFFLRYVTHDRRVSYEALGWQCVGDGSRMGSHGLWSCVMKWAGDGEPREPGVGLKAAHDGLGSVQKGIEP